MATPAGGFEEVTDGDTLRVSFSIRLAGIKSEDGSELDERAKARIQELLTDEKGNRKRVDVSWYGGETTYRRLTAKIEFNHEGRTVDLGQLLYDEGYVTKVSPRPMAAEE